MTVRPLDELEPEVWDPPTWHRWNSDPVGSPVIGDGPIAARKIDGDWIACRAGEQEWLDPVGNLAVRRIGVPRPWQAVQVDDAECVAAEGSRT